MDEVVWSMMFYLNMSQGQNDHFTWQKKRPGQRMIYNCGGFTLLSWIAGG